MDEGKLFSLCIILLSFVLLWWYQIQSH